MTPFDPPGEPDRLALRYTQIARFMRAPLAQSLAEVDIGLIGAPYDGALTNRPGARRGPREVHNQSSLMRAIDHATRGNPFEFARIADLGDIPFSRASSAKLRNPASLRLRSAAITRSPCRSSAPWLENRWR